MCLLGCPKSENCVLLRLNSVYSPAPSAISLSPSLRRRTVECFFPNAGSCLRLFPHYYAPSSRSRCRSKQGSSLGVKIAGRILARGNAHRKILSRLAQISSSQVGGVIRSGLETNDTLHASGPSLESNDLVNLLALALTHVHYDRPASSFRAVAKCSWMHACRVVPGAFR
jgi:hypothetical protein